MVEKRIVVVWELSQAPLNRFQIVTMVKLFPNKCSPCVSLSLIINNFLLVLVQLQINFCTNSRLVRAKMSTKYFHLQVSRWRNYLRHSQVTSFKMKKFCFTMTVLLDGVDGANDGHVSGEDEEVVAGAATGNGMERSEVDFSAVGISQREFLRQLNGQRGNPTPSGIFSTGGGMDLMFPGTMGAMSAMDGAGGMDPIFSPFYGTDYSAENFQGFFTGINPQQEGGMIPPGMIPPSMNMYHGRPDLEEEQARKIARREKTAKALNIVGGKF